MPIRINLLAEAIAAEDLRRRDPVKRAIYAGAFLVVLTLVWFSSGWLQYMVEKQNLNHLESGIESHSNDWAQVQNNLKKITDVQSRIDALDKLSAGRFLQGNLLNALQVTYLPNVQLARVHVDQSYSAPAKSSRSSDTTEHIVLTLDAKDSSPNPGDQLNHFKDTILNQEYFKQNLAATNNSIRLLGESPVQTPPDAKPFVMFTLECRFQDRTQ